MISVNSVVRTSSSKILINANSVFLCAFKMKLLSQRSRRKKNSEGDSFVNKKEYESWWYNWKRGKNAKPAHREEKARVSNYVKIASCKRKNRRG